MVDSVITTRLARSSASYPLPDLSTRQKQILVAALKEAWGGVESSGAKLTDEDTITGHLVEELRILHKNGTVSGFSITAFQTPVRDAVELNYNGEALEKRPDITFRLAGEPDPMRAWFVECKLVDSTHPVSNYKKKGIARFERGDYAWTMQSAAMIAYNARSFPIQKKLKISTLRISTIDADSRVRESTHARPFQYVSHNHGPGDIVLLHLWVR